MNKEIKHDPPLSISILTIQMDNSLIFMKRPFSTVHRNDTCAQIVIITWHDQRCSRLWSKCSNLWSNILLKNLPPFLPKLVPTTLDARRDLVSGLHFSSLRMENKLDSAGEISLSFMFLHDTTLRLSISFHERITDSRQSVVSNEHPSKDTNFNLLW